MTAASKLRGIGAAAAEGFFDTIGMAREFWAEDPSWTNPGDGSDMVTWRDNGSIGSDVTAAIEVGGTLPTFVDSGVNSLPSVNLNNSSESNGGYLSTTTGTTSSAAFTIVAVANLPSAAWQNRLITSSTSGSFLSLGTRGVSWYTWHNGELSLETGTTATGDHLFVWRCADNDLELFIDGASIGTDTSGSVGDTTGFIIGCRQDFVEEFWNGPVAYVAQYDGDLTAHADYADYTTAITDYYGI